MRCLEVAVFIGSCGFMNCVGDLDSRNFVSLVIRMVNLSSLILVLEVMNSMENSKAIMVGDFLFSSQDYSIESITF